MAVVIATCTTHISESQQIVEGRLYLADDPVVRAHPGLFTTDLERYAMGYIVPVVEDTTAAPGEVRRGPGRPRKEPSNV